MSVLENPLLIPPVQMYSDNINLLLRKDIILDMQSGKYEILLFDLNVLKLKNVSFFGGSGSKFLLFF